MNGYIVRLEAIEEARILEYMKEDNSILHRMSLDESRDVSSNVSGRSRNRKQNKIRKQNKKFYQEANAIKL